MKTKMCKKKENPNSKYWLHKADAEWGKWMHNKYYRCAFSLSDGNGRCAGKLEAHHIISRAVRCLRHHILNGVLLCSKHHQFDNKVAPHCNPLGFTTILKAWCPIRFQWAEQHKWDTGKFNYKEAYETLVKLNAGTVK